MGALEIKNLNKSYGKYKALNNINITIKEGMYGLLGPNGAGKTTLMRILTTLLECDNGEITYGEINWENGDKVRSLLGYLPQHFSMYKNMKLEEILEYIATLKGIKENEVKEEIERVLRETNLYSDKNKKIKELSGGMVRRFGIAQAILGDPRILIVDEPTTGLDPEKRIEFRNLLNDLVGKKIIIISTHIVEDIEATCDQVCVIDKGNILYSGDLTELREKAKGKIYEGLYTKEEIKDIRKKVKVISSKYKGDGVILRYTSEEGHIIDNSFIVEPTLEDAYFCMIGEKRE
ncbi:MAG: ABC transporter ATP-binding protein [Romboutsia sp.]|uniref:ABC transporter ATP-binding protein n=1 Tax=Romboutsia sp. TaxID=1965302 RepID=UPI003F2D173C